jgi:hypothetical protein
MYVIFLCCASCFPRGSLIIRGDEKVVTTDMGPELLALARSAIRRARREKTDLTDQADLIKATLAQNSHLLPKPVIPAPPAGTKAVPAPPAIQYKHAGLHVIIGRKYRGVHDQQPGTTAQIRAGGLIYTIFAHSIPAPKVSPMKKFLQPGMLLKLMFVFFFLAWMMGFRPFGFGPAPGS